MSRKDIKRIAESWEKISYTDSGQRSYDIAQHPDQHGEHQGYPKGSMFILRSKSDLLELLNMPMLADSASATHRLVPARPRHILYKNAVYKLNRARSNSFRYQYISKDWVDTSKDSLPAGKEHRDISHGMRDITFEIIMVTATGLSVMTPTQYTDKGKVRFPNGTEFFIDIPTDEKGEYSSNNASKPGPDRRGAKLVPLMTVGNPNLRSIHKQYIDYTDATNALLGYPYYLLVGDTHYEAQGMPDTYNITTYSSDPSAGKEKNIYNNMVSYEDDKDLGLGLQYFIGSDGVIQYIDHGAAGRTGIRYGAIVYDAKTNQVFTPSDITFETEDGHKWSR